MNESKEDGILKELRHISKLLTLAVTRELKTDKEKIELLSNIGFQPTEIAHLLGIQPSTVTARLSDIRKKARTGKGKKVKPSKE
jgi:DNA-directed RNA polymerase specialized sigma24 family protein